jgi:uncharacterized protein
MKEKIQQIIDNLKAEREECGERIVSLHYAYDSAIEQLEKLVKED